MRALIPVLLAFVAPLTNANAQGTMARPMLPPSVTAGGEGTRNVAPDQVTIILGVMTRAKTAAQAGADNATRMTAVVAALKRAGLEEKEISTANYSVHGEMWRSEAETVYVANNSVKVQTRKLDRLAAIIDGSLQAGANQVHSMQYDLADRGPATREALALAVRHARLQAEAMATAAGGQLGALEELTTEPAQFVPIMARAEMAMAAKDASTPLTPGEVTVTATVRARWRFVPRR